MNPRVIRIRPTTRAGTVALATGVIVVGGVLVVVGATLLLALGVAAATVGTGIVAWRRLTGRGGDSPPERHGRVPPLDPSLEVFPDPAPEFPRLPPSA